MPQVHKEFLVCNFTFNKTNTCKMLKNEPFSVLSTVVEQLAGNDHVLNHLSVPAACFTHPEISMVGLTEVNYHYIKLGCIY